MLRLCWVWGVFGSLASFFALLVAVTPRIEASTITVSSLGVSTTKVFDMDGNNLAAGSTWRLGLFNSVGGDPLVLSAEERAILESSIDFYEIDALFTPLGEANDPYGTGSRAPFPSVADGGEVSSLGQPGTPNGGDGMIVNRFPSGTAANEGDMFGQVKFWDGTSASDVTTPHPDGYFPENTPLFWWVFNSSDPVTATQMGIFTAATWLTPDPNDDFDAQVTSADTVDDVIRGSAGAGGATGSITPGSFSELRLAEVIPEPSRLLLMVLGIAAVLFQRRRSV